MPTAGTNRLCSRVNVIAEPSSSSLFETPSAGNDTREIASLVLDDKHRYHIRMPRDINELFQVAVLRAECYYEDRPFTRFVDSFKSEYARAEFRRLKAQQVDTFDPSRLNCLICVDRSAGSSEGSVVGSIDVNDMSNVANKLKVPGYDGGDSGASNKAANADTYLSNFCIREDHRRNKLGTLLVSCASKVLYTAAKGRKVYAHVNRTNQVALTFYKKQDFKLMAEKPRSFLLQTNSPVDLICLCKNA